MYAGLYLYLDVEDPGFNTSISLVKGRLSPFLHRCCSSLATKLFFYTSPEWVGYSGHGLMECRISVTMRGTQPCIISLPWTVFCDDTIASPTALLSWSSMWTRSPKKRTFTQDIYYTNLVCLVTRFVQNIGVLVLEGLINRERMSWIHENCEQYCFFFRSK